MKINMVLFSDLWTYLIVRKHVKNTSKNKSNYASLYKKCTAISPFCLYEIESYLATLQDSNSHKNNLIKTIKNIVHTVFYLEEQQKVCIRDRTGLEKILTLSYFEKKRLKQIEVLTPSEVDKIIHARLPYKREDGDYLNLKYKIAIYLLALGLRISEVTELKWENVKHDFILVEEGKTKNSYRKVYLPDVIRKDVKKLKKINEYVFASRIGHISTQRFRTIVKKKAKIAGIQKKVYPHVLRHSFITTSIENGVSLPALSQHVGHKNWSVTQEYTHLSLKHTQHVVESYDLFRDNSLDKIKKIITQEIHKITDKKKLKSVYYILKT